MRSLNNIVAIMLLAGGCTTTAMAPPVVPSDRPAAVSHDDYRDLLGRYVALDGRIDYAGWSGTARDVEALGRYVDRLLAHPPQRSPGHFATDADRLAYWLNLYNALVQREILARWPIDVIDAKSTLHGVVFDVGGSEMSLADIESRIIRTTFSDPRAHFAISCGAVSCPLLPTTPFDGITLDRRLDQAARSFINRTRNVQVDHETKQIRVSPIFGWYQADFIRFVKSRGTHPAPQLSDLLAMYAEPPLREALTRAIRGRYQVELLPFDWRVNHIGALVERPPETSVEAVSGAFPNLTLRRLDGSSFTIDDFRGKVVLVDFWATWCKPCLWSFPRYTELLMAHEKDGLVVVAVAQDDNPKPVAAFVDANNVAFDIGIDATQAAAEEPLGVTALPTIIVVDREGVMRFRHEGYAAAGFRELEAKLEELLAEPSPNG